MQLKKSIFGEVIDHLEVDHIKEILIPLPDKVLQNNIGNLSLLAYQKRDEANKRNHKRDQRIINLHKKIQEHNENEVKKIIEDANQRRQ